MKYAAGKGKNEKHIFALESDDGGLHQGFGFTCAKEKFQKKQWLPLFAPIMFELTKEVGSRYRTLARLSVPLQALFRTNNVISIIIMSE
jgi:hypothetical protein